MQLKMLWLALVGIWGFSPMVAVAGFTDEQARTVVVHEWGTFTSLQNENGEAIGGINTDDEPVPAFVHDLSRSLLTPPSELPPRFFNKGVPPCHPDVTMRLETPVIYFHPPDGTQRRVDVRVKFRGGWLTQFYPDAEAVAPGIEKNGMAGALRPETVSSLEWPRLTLKAEGAGPETTDRVWLAPRGAKSAMVANIKGEREQFLFYRGVGNLDAPLRVKRGGDGSLVILPHEDAADVAREIRTVWFVEVRGDGSAAWRRQEQTAGGALVVPDAAFPELSFSTTALAGVRVEMKAALVADGLYPDEAEAMLATWEVSYFQSPGVRLFFLVPRAWTDRVLPLEISGETKVTRSMVGRIELVTPRQRALLREVAEGAGFDFEKHVAVPLTAGLTGPAKEDWQGVFSGKKRLADVGLEMPASYRAYLQLGRFRNALVLDEQRRAPSAGLAAFIASLGLGTR